MRRHRLPLGVLVAALLLAGLLTRAPAVGAVGVWTAATPPRDIPEAYAAITLRTGLVLVVSVFLGNPDLPADSGVATYDPATDRWSPRATWPFARGYEAPVALSDGRVLFTGGTLYADGVDHALAVAQVYDPATATWAPVAPLRLARAGHTATVLRDGTVLVVGGATAPGTLHHAVTGSVERYDPRADRWTPAAPLRTPRAWHTATLLQDGRVLVVGGEAAGGDTASAEIYDPAADRWTPAADLARPRATHTAVLLPDGRVLVTSGRLNGGAELATAEVYDPATGRWTPTGPQTAARAWDSVVPLSDGRVFAIGGVSFADTHPQDLQTTELYDPATNAWAPATPLITLTQALVAARLLDGRVLVVGFDDAGTAAAIYTPAPSPAACFPATGKCVRGPFLAYWQAHGGLAINGYPLTDEFVQVLEDGQAYQVQYFERVRLEYHPENPPPGDIELGQFGRRILRAGRGIAPPAQPKDGDTFFPVTGHNVAPDFYAYWQAHGGLAQFGYPLSEEFLEPLADGKAYTVQYFERARFERHPENAPPYTIELGQFGRRILAENGR
ncbi:MAG TPA: kelch repeat-containing protein [Thermomicrobiales bacterium]|nr:kelch repeat-containing protein [Thermomicrobiales bacterium]